MNAAQKSNVGLRIRNNVKSDIQTDVFAKFLRVVLLPLAVAVLSFAGLTSAQAQTFSVGDFDVYINDQAGFEALGTSTTAGDPVGGDPTTYAGGITISSSYAISLANGAFAVSGNSTRIDPPELAVTTGTATITDSSPVAALGFNIVDIFDHNGGFRDTFTFSANGTPLFTLSDGFTINASETGTVQAREIDGTLITNLTAGQATATFIGVVNTATGGSVSTLTVGYDYNSASGSTNRDFHGLDAIASVAIAPTAEDDELLNQTSGATVSLDILDNDGGLPALDADSVNLIVPTGITAEDVVTTGGNITSFTVPDEGTWTYNPATGALEFNPDEDFLGNPTDITYTVDTTDGLESNAATVNVEYVEPNEILAQDDVLADPVTASTDLTAVLNVLAGNGNGVDTLDGATVTSSLVTVALDDGQTLPAGVTLNADGTVDVAEGTTPGDITFTYEICEIDNPGNCDTATAMFTIAEPNVAPTADDDQLSDLPLGVAVPVTVLTNDDDADDGLDAASVVLTSTFGELALDGKSLVVENQGTWTVADSGVVTFTPLATFEGDPTPVTYQVSDTLGTPSNEATITLLFQDPPVANDDAVSTETIGTSSFSLVANDTDTEDTTVAADTVSLIVPAGATDVVTDGDGDIVGFTVADQGTWSLTQSGTVTFAPVDGLSIDPTPILYTVDDSDGNTSNQATASLDFGERPVADDDSFVSLTVEAVMFDIVGNDMDPDGNIDDATVSLIVPAGATDVITESAGPFGSETETIGFTVPGQGTWAVDNSGQITFTPDPDLVGNPTPITYTVDDDFGNESNIAEISVLFGDTPVANDDEETSALIAAVPVNVVDNDEDPDGNIDASTVSFVVPADATDVVTDGDGDVIGFTVTDEGTWTVDDAGVATFTPNDDLVGNPTVVSYTVDDNSGNTTDPATITITFGEPPVAQDDLLGSLPVNTPAEINPLLNDEDPDGELDSASIVLTGTDAPAGSELSGGGTSLVVPDQGTWTVAGGLVTFTPLDTFTGNPTPVAYQVSDDAGNPSNEALITLEFEEPLVAEDDVVVATEPGAVTVNPIDNDSGNSLVAGTLVLTGTGAPEGSELSADGLTLMVPDQGTWVVEPSDGSVTFTPVDGFSGQPTPAGYTVEDINGTTSNIAFISLTVLPPLAMEIIAIDDGPITVNGTDGATTDFSVLDNDTLGGDPINDPDQVVLTSVSLLPTPPNGSITVGSDGTIIVAAGTTPDTYTVVYEICEATNTGNCATASVEVIVVEVDDELITSIEEDLESILEEDLANTLTQQSNQIRGYSANALDRLQRRTPNTCLADVNARLAVENVQFDTDRAIIKPESRATLDELATILGSCAGSAFEIAGHTDSDASDAYNLDLSQRRAAAVLTALSSRGVNTSGFAARGYGESEPIASNATAEGKLQNRRVEFRALNTVDVANGHNGQCGDGFSLVRNFDANADENGVAANGDFSRDSYSCVTDSREVFEGTLSYIDTDTGQTQSAINLSYRREKYRGSESVFGYFGGLYGSQSNVTRLADGEIDGYGINGGIYGANRLNDGNLFLDYYLGAAAGRHDFDLDFERDIGTISATGDYTYLAGFAGAAVSGEVEMGQTTIRPRVGFDYVYTPDNDVDVIADLGGLSQAGDLELDSISGGRLFAEIRTEQLIRDGEALLYLNPRASCYESLGELDGVCGLGGAIGIVSAKDDNGLTYAFELDSEFGQDYAFGSVSMSIARELAIGSINGDAGLASNGELNIGGGFAMDF